MLERGFYGDFKFFLQFAEEINNFLKQAGAELGQAQLKLELELCYTFLRF